MCVCIYIQYTSSSDKYVTETGEQENENEHAP